MTSKLFLGLFLIAFSASSAAEPVLPAEVDDSEFRSFFENYAALGQLYDVAIVDMYSDAATITAVRVMPDGAEQKIAIDGKKWKQLIVDSMEIAKRRGDNSKFSEIQFARDGDVVKITATRYSAIKCFEDKTYSLSLKKDAEGKIAIIKEFSRSPQQSNCEKVPENDLDLVLQATVKTISKQLPIMLDSDTKLENVSSEGKVLVYQYELVHYASSNLDAVALKKAVESLAIRQACASSNLKTLLDRDATISYRYNGNDKVQVLEVNVNKLSCL